MLRKSMNRRLVARRRVAVVAIAVSSALFASTAHALPGAPGQPAASASPGVLQATTSAMPKPLAAVKQLIQDPVPSVIRGVAPVPLVGPLVGSVLRHTNSPGDYLAYLRRGGYFPRGATPIPPAHTTKGPPAPLRIGTFNAQWLPTAFRTKPIAAATELVQRIKAAHYDVIALNEVFDEDARRVLRRGLRGRYPNYISALDEYGALEDSGLMLFTSLEVKENIGGAQPFLGTCEGTLCNNANFVIYEACEDQSPVSILIGGWFDAECRAAKGAGLVRLHNPVDDRYINVAFTHTAAAYQDDDDAEAAYQHAITRGAQLDELRRLIERSLKPENMEKEELFVLGDLNIDGDTSVLASSARSAYNQRNSQEWHTRFDPEYPIANPLAPPLVPAPPGNPAPPFMGGRFAPFGMTMIDSWWDSQPSTDLGYTNRFIWPDVSGKRQGHTGARLDYVLHTKQSAYCVSHIQLSHFLRSGDTVVGESGLGEVNTEIRDHELSDHLGLTADLSAPKNHCESAFPEPLSLAPGQQLTLTGALVRGGSKWYRIDEPGTYSINQDAANGVSTQLYSADDFSTPLMPYRGLKEDVEGVERPMSIFALPEAPIYVRVYAKDKRLVRGFAVALLHHGCSSPQDVCMAYPGYPATAAFPANEPLGAYDMAWFRFDTDKPDVEQNEDPLLLLSSPDAADQFDLILRDEDGAPLEAANATTHQISRTDPGGTTLLATLARHAPDGGAPLTEQVTSLLWTTNLTATYAGTKPPQEFVAIEDGEIGTEIYWVSVIVDGKITVQEEFIGPYPQPFPAVLDHYIGTRRFLHSIEIRVQESDNEPYPGILETCLSDITHEGTESDDDCINFKIEALDPSEASLELSRTTQDDEGYGEYQLTMPLKHYVDFVPPTPSDHF